jgi:hypothetical protein
MGCIVVLILNNHKRNHNISYSLRLKQPYSANGTVIYPRGATIPFKGIPQDSKSTIAKIFGDTMERDNINYVIETVAQLPFSKDDVIIDDMGIEHLIVNVRFDEDKNQAKYLRSAYLSRVYYLGVDRDE